MISLNLLPDVKKNLISIRRQRNMIMSIGIVTIIVCLVVLAILGACFGALVAIGASTKANIDQKAAQIKQAQSSKQLDRYLTVQNQIKQLDSLKQQQPIYSRIFDYINALKTPAPSDVKISKIDLSNESGSAPEVVLSGTASEFRSLEVYRKIMEGSKLKFADTGGGDAGNEKQLFSQVNDPIYSSSYSTDGWQVSFTIKATFSPEAFSSQVANVTVEVPTGVLANDSDRAPDDKNSSTGDSTDSNGR